MLRKLISAKPNALVSISILLTLSFFPCAATGQDSKAAQSCPYPGPLTLAEVLVDIRSNVRYDRLTTFVTTCHVAFSLDLKTLDQLAVEKVPGPVMDSLNKDTVSRLTMDQARSELASLVAYASGAQDGAAPAAMPGRMKMENEYQAKKSALVQPGERGEFEKQADYDDKVRRWHEETDRLEANHKKQVAGYFAVILKRIDFLKTSSYPVGEQSVYQSYDPDGLELRVLVNDHEYLFSGVEPEVAKAFKENWSNVQTGRKFDDDGMRFLSLPDGRLRMVGETPETVHEQRAAGTWVDSQTGLMWTVRGSDSEMQFRPAMEYCRQVQVGGYSDWILPTIDELEGLVADKRRGGIKGGILLRDRGRTGFWSGSLPGWDEQSTTIPDRANPMINEQVRFNGPWRFVFPEGKRTNSNYDYTANAICRRRADTGGIRSAGTNTAGPGPGTVSPVAQDPAAVKMQAFLQRLEPAGIWLDPSTKLMWTAKDSDNIVDYQAAKAYCEALELGGLKQWRLPTIRELPGLYDPSNTRASNKGLAFGEGKLPYHIKPYIELHNPLIWSSDQWFRDEWSSVQPGNESAYLFNFQTGRTAADRFNSKRTLENGQYLAHHALCVRRFNPDNDAGPDAPQPAGGPRNQQDSLPAQATDSTDAKKVAQRAKVIARFRKDCDMGGPPGCFLLGKAYMEGDGVPKDTQMALEFLDKSCSLGEHKGCTYAAQLRQH